MNVTNPNKNGIEWSYFLETMFVNDYFLETILLLANVNHEKYRWPRLRIMNFFFFFYAEVFKNF